jgi:hypothetical protein
VGPDSASYVQALGLVLFVAAAAPAAVLLEALLLLLVLLLSSPRARQQPLLSPKACNLSCTWAPKLATATEVAAMTTTATQVCYKGWWRCRGLAVPPCNAAHSCNIAMGLSGLPRAALSAAHCAMA